MNMRVYGGFMAMDRQITDIKGTEDGQMIGK
jgi:hypothetical protein